MWRSGCLQRVIVDQRGFQMTPVVGKKEYQATAFLSFFKKFSNLWLETEVVI